MIYFRGPITLLHVMDKPGFHEPLELLLRAIPYQIDGLVSMKFVNLGNKCGLSYGKVQEVVELLPHARLLYHNILLVCLGFLDDIEVENRMTALYSLDRFF